MHISKQNEADNKAILHSSIPKHSREMAPVFSKPLIIISDTSNILRVERIVEDWGEHFLM